MMTHVTAEEVSKAIHNAKDKGITCAYSFEVLFEGIYELLLKERAKTIEEQERIGYLKAFEDLERQCAADAEAGNGRSTREVILLLKEAKDTSTNQHQ